MLGTKGEKGVRKWGLYRKEDVSKSFYLSSKANGFKEQKEVRGGWP